MRIEHCELRFLNLPMAQPELWPGAATWRCRATRITSPTTTSPRHFGYADGLIRIDDAAPGLGLAIDEAKVATFAGAYERDGMSSTYTKSRAGGIVTVPSQ
jgi:hypothetical protein